MTTLQQVHVRVNDAATGKPTPCRVRFTDAEGKYYAPHGRLTEFATGPGVDVGGNVLVGTNSVDGKIVTKQFAYIDGGCEIALPPGLIHVTICKGPEYFVLHEQILLAAGKLALRFELERWSNLRQHDWYPGDTRAHAMSPHSAWLDGAGEDLAVVNVLARMALLQDGDSWLESFKLQVACANLLEFSGQQTALEREGCMVVVNTHNWHPRLGSLALLNCHRIVYPLVFGTPAFAAPYDNWTLADWCEQCHRKKGLVVWTHTDMDVANNKPGEPLADLILGKVDAVEVERFGGNDPPHPWRFIWYDMLNCGFRVPLAGASGKDSNCLPLGCVRTYARLQPQQSFTYTNWIEAIRAGRTFATNGPLLLLGVNGQDPGATLHLATEQPLRVCAEAHSAVPFEQLEIVVNGEVVANQTPSGNPATARIEAEIRIPQGGWIAARCWGNTWLPGGYLGQRVYAHTSPVYVRIDGQPAPVDAAAAKRLLGHLDNTLAWVNNEGRYENDAQRQRLAGIFHEARRVLEHKLARQ